MVRLIRSISETNKTAWTHTELTLQRRGHGADEEAGEDPHFCKRHCWGCDLCLHDGGWAHGLLSQTPRTHIWCQLEEVVVCKEPTPLSFSRLTHRPKISCFLPRVNNQELLSWFLQHLQWLCSALSAPLQDTLLLTPLTPQLFGVAVTQGGSPTH